MTETVSGPGESTGESPGDGPGPAPGETHFHTEPSPPARCLLTSQAVVHQATDPEIAVWLAADPVQAEQARRHGLHSLIAAPLKARGKDLGVVLLVRHTASREPFTEDDLFVTENLVARAAICMDNARRYARERRPLPPSMYRAPAPDSHRPYRTYSPHPETWWSRPPR